MEIANKSQTEEQQNEKWSSILNCLDDCDDEKTKKQITEIIQKRRDEEKEKSKNYKLRQELEKQMTSIKEIAPHKALSLMMELQIAIDNEDFETASRLMFNPDDDNNLMDTIADLLFLSNHTEILKAKRFMNTSQKLSRAEVLAKAHDPAYPKFGFCPKCNRPMRISSIKNHQLNTSVCVEIKAGRQKSLELGKRKDKTIGSYIAIQSVLDPNDSDDNEE